MRLTTSQKQRLKEAILQDLDSTGGLNNDFIAGCIVGTVASTLETFSDRVSNEEEANMDDPYFPGDPDYSKEKDQEHLTKNMLKVFSFMVDGKWHTNADISRATGVPEPSATACYRAFRRKECGAHTVERRRQENSRERLYRLIPNTESLIYRNYISNYPILHE